MRESEEGGGAVEPENIFLVKIAFKSVVYTSVGCDRISEDFGRSKPPSRVMRYL